MLEEVERWLSTPLLVRVPTVRSTELLAAKRATGHGERRAARAERGGDGRRDRRGDPSRADAEAGARSSTSWWCIDSGSTDRTAEVAAAAGARVVHRDDDPAAACPRCPARARCCGARCWSPAATSSASSTRTCGTSPPTSSPGSSARCSPTRTCELVKAMYDRPLGDAAGQGGRVTELVARPLLNLHWPQLAGFVQPLGGEYAARRSLLERLPVPRRVRRGAGPAGRRAAHGRASTRWPRSTSASRKHRHQDGQALGRMAAAIYRTAQLRLARGPSGPARRSPSSNARDDGRLRAAHVLRGHGGAAADARDRGVRGAARGVGTRLQARAHRVDAAGRGPASRLSDPGAARFRPWSSSSASQQDRAQVLVASNRGPVSYTLGDDGSLTAKRGGGGLVSGLSAIAARSADARCGCARPSATATGRRCGAGRRLDRDTAARTDAGHRRRHPRRRVQRHRQLRALVRPPHALPDARWSRSSTRSSGAQWASYERYNRAFADALAEEAAEGAAVLVQDYHLALVPGHAARAAAPTCGSGTSRTRRGLRRTTSGCCPTTSPSRCCAGMLGADRAGVPDPALGGRVRGLLRTRARRPYRWDETTRAESRSGRTTRIGVHGLGADADFLRERAARGRMSTSGWRRCASRSAATRTGSRAGDRPGRPDRAVQEHRARPARVPAAARRTAPSGASGSCMSPSPTRRGRTWRSTATTRPRSSASPRRSTPTYGTAGWTPVVLHVKDDFARSLAAYRLADVALVNPIRDGMNLVAKEMPVVSDDGCALVLSREAGAYEELGEDAIVVNPYDVGGHRPRTARGADDGARRSARSAPSGWRRRRRRCRRTRGSWTSCTR